MGRLDTILIIQLAVTWMLIGIVWLAQLVTYPLFSKIKINFVHYERSYVRRTACFIAPLMILEVVTAIYLIGVANETLLNRLAAVNLILLACVWLSTFLFQIHQLQKLSVHFSKKILHMLIASNWIRTILWTAKGGVLIWMVLIAI